MVSTLAEIAGDRMRHLRRLRGWSQRDLVRRTQMRQPQVSGYESGKVLPSVETLVLLAEVFEVPVAVLLLDLGDARQAEALRVLLQGYQR